MKLGITAKYTLALVLIAVLLGAILTFAAIGQVNELSSQKFNKIVSNLINEQVTAIAHTFDAGIESMDEVTNAKRMQGVVDRNLKYQGEFIKEIRVHAPDKTSKNGYRAIAGNAEVGVESDPEDIEAIKNDKVVILRDKADGEDVIDVTIPLHVEGKSVATAGIMFAVPGAEDEEAKVVAAEKDKLIKEFIVITLVAILLAVIIGYFVSRKLTSSIKRFTEIAEKLSLGDFNVDPHVDSDDEVGKLSEAFERLVVAVKFFKGEEG